MLEEPFIFLTLIQPSQYFLANFQNNIQNKVEFLILSKLNNLLLKIVSFGTTMEHKETFSTLFQTEQLL